MSNVSQPVYGLTSNEVLKHCRKSVSFGCSKIGSLVVINVQKINDAVQSKAEK